MNNYAKKVFILLTIACTVSAGDKVQWDSFERADICDLASSCAGHHIAAVEPAGACEVAIPRSLSITSTGGFLRIDQNEPMVRFDGAPTPPGLLQNCTPCPSDSPESPVIEVCTELFMDVPPGLAADVYPIEITNPAPKPCYDVTQFAVAPPPQLDVALPDRSCADLVDFRMQVDGAGFFPQTRFWLQELSGVEAMPKDTNLISSNQVVVTFAPLGPGLYDVIASNGPGCEALLRAAIEISDC